MADDTARVVARLQALQGEGRVDFVLDNFGYELFTDLTLAYALLDRGWCQEVVLHCKEAPFYVSDASAADVESLLEHLLGLGSAPARSVAQGLGRFHAEGRLQWTTDPFWMAPSEFIDMPAGVRGQLAQVPPRAPPPCPCFPSTTTTTTPVS